MRGTHQGQQSPRTALTGRTHDCKRPLHHTPHDLLRGGGHPHMTARSIIGGYTTESDGKRVLGPARASRPQLLRKCLRLEVIPRFSNQLPSDFDPDVFLTDARVLFSQREGRVG